MKTMLLSILGVSAMLAMPATAQLPLPPPVPPAHGPENCTAAYHRQFDFMVGEWRVFRTGTTESIGVSSVVRAHGDCVIQEDFHPYTLITGMGLSSYDRADGAWHQYWVDSLNARVDFTGGMRDGAMVFTGLWRNYSGPGKDRTVRLTYRREGADVHFLGEVEKDGGNWGPSFDLTYKPRAP